MGILFIIVLIGVAVYAGLMIWYAIKWQSLKDFAPANSMVHVSIIVPARNESRNIERLLESARMLEYDEQLFEIIIVDDHSSDNTIEIVNRYVSSSPNLKLLKLEGNETSKKTALTAGIIHADGELIITTDADCTLGKEFLKAISSEYCRSKPEMIISPVVIRPGNTIIGMFQSLDFLAIQGITMSGVHQLCNGANLAFTKKAFLMVNGYEGIDDIASGDDVLLLKKFIEMYPGRISILKDRRAIVETSPVTNISDFIQQRIRWSGKWKRLPIKDISVLSFVFLVNVLLTIFLISAFVIPDTELNNYQVGSLFLWLILVGLKCLSELLIMLPASKFFSLQKYMVWFPLIQPFHIIYTSIAGLLGIRGKYSWKGRNLK